MGERRVAFISGGTSGIGLATAKAFRADDIHVVLMGRSHERGMQALAELADEHVHYIGGDVTVLADCRAAIECIQREFGRLDILVNSAGIYHEGAIEEVDEETFDAVMDTNVKGTYFLTQAALPLLKQSKGNIVNVASDAGVHGNYFCAAYCASKGAVVLFTRSLALEVASFGVRVNAVAPGDILTPLTEQQLQRTPDRAEALREMAMPYPIGRIGTAEETAAVIAFLASEKAGFVTGSVWGIDGGLTA